MTIRPLMRQGYWVLLMELVGIIEGDVLNSIYSEYVFFIKKKGLLAFFRKRERAFKAA
ncbi:Uncharacterised protein [Yersinia mollaretii]|uniref:Uncharacterized protein n=1 Tax=Yersinia mollaretii TaxID=33060 RepID=A0AA36LK17_YERMO|nr:Uncharacterised protein [Yersinia mollaretii]